jgi:hypothetical protein
MKAVDWKRFAKPVLGEGWQFSKLFAYCAPVGWVVRGVLAERSSQGGFYLWEVRLPLYFPTDVLVLDWSERIGGGTRVWTVCPETALVLEREGARIGAKAAASVSLLLDPPGGADNVSMQEARAYGLVVVGRVESAVEVLGRVLQYEPKYDWEHVMFARAKGVREQLVKGDVQGVMRLLAEWRRQSAESLGIAVEG